MLSKALEETQGTKCFEMETVSLVDFPGPASAPQQQHTQTQEEGDNSRRTAHTERKAMDSSKAEKNINTVRKCYLQES